MLQGFIELNREEIIQRCRAKVATRSLPPVTEAEINYGVPLFLDELVDALRSGTTSAQIGRSAGQHGHDLLLQGLSISQVVHDYGDVCQTITELAVETNAPISTDDFRTLNRCLDDAIAAAVTTFGRESQERASEQQQEAMARSNERVSFLVHELRNLVSTAIVAFEVLKTGNVGVSGVTGGVLNRSLVGLQQLIAHSLDEVRVTKGTTKKKQIAVSRFIENAAAAAELTANTRGLTLVVEPVDDGLTIEGDPQILMAVVGNLLQNGFKFTEPSTTVTLRVRASADRILIEVEDECGGLPGGGDAEELPPSFEQRGADRSGLGVGLAFSRWGAEVNDGRLYARNLPGKGCVFTVDLPRCPIPAVVP
jgi:signal transduction histidine kinase